MRRSTMKPSDWCFVVATCTPIPAPVDWALRKLGAALRKVGA